MSIEKSREQCIEELAKIIEDNPDCEFQIDNDVWSIMKNKSKCIEDETYYNGNCLAHSEKYKFRSNWYSESWGYGFGLADVLVYLLNKKGFNIKAESV